jgi:nucleoside-diphosphate-sugar epimerase
MADFIRHGINGERIVMLDEGTSIRSYCYIMDATVAFFKILLSDSNGEVFNVGSGKEPITIRKLAELIHELCGIKALPQYKNKKIVEYVREAPKQVCPDITKIKTMFGYEPRINMKERLKRTINWNLAKLNKIPL